jgi:hypothetical protein
MKKILVHFYGYKSKLMPEAVEQIVLNQSGQNAIDVVVYDQTNVSRSEKFNNHEYHHIHWDSLLSRFSYINISKSKNNYDFFMYVDGAKMFEKNWDLELVMGSQDRQLVFSGNNKIVFNKEKYRFYPTYSKQKIDLATETGWLVKDFFFIPFDLFKVLPDTSIFKYHGMEEFCSMFLARNLIPVVAISSAWVKDLEPDILEKDFLPFSIYHNYSKVIDSFKKIPGSVLGVDELSKVTGYNFSVLKYFPYPVNDVEYNAMMNLDLMSERRFHDTQKSLY